MGLALCILLSYSAVGKLEHLRSGWETFLQVVILCEGSNEISGQLSSDFLAPADGDAETENDARSGFSLSSAPGATSGDF